MIYKLSIYFLILFTSCANLDNERKQNHGDVNESNIINSNQQTKTSLAIVKDEALRLINDRHCNICDTEILLKVDSNIGELTTEIISEFFCTINTDCEFNVEFSQWSNELMFKILFLEPKAFYFFYSNGNKKEVVHRVIESPIHDGIDISEILERVELEIDTFEASQLMNSLRTARSKY